MAKVSIVIPVFNLANDIGRCLESCIYQTYNDIEVVVVNDGSTDNSKQIIEEYCRKDKRIKLIDKPNGGVAMARKTGLDKSMGEWVMFVDGDDYIRNDAVELLLKNALDANASIALANNLYVKKFREISQKNQIPEHRDAINAIKYILTERISFSLCGKIFRRDLFIDIKTCNKLKIGEDSFWTTQLLLNSEGSVSYINEDLYVYVARDDSAMRRPSQEAIESRLLFVKQIKQLLAESLHENVTLIRDEIDAFCINEYYGYLLMGGKWSHLPSDRKLIENYWHRTTDNRVQHYLLRAYAINPYFGSVTMGLYRRLKSFARCISAFLAKK